MERHEEEMVTLKSRQPLDEHRTKSRRDEDTREKCHGRCFKEYCQHTSIHGVQYFAADDRPTYERVFWCLAFLISFLYCGMSIYALYMKWKSSPTIISFNEYELKITKYPFPAVTVCPQDKVSNDILDVQNTEGLSNQSEKIKGYFQAYSQLCGDKNKEIQEQLKMEKFENFDMSEALNEIFPNHGTAFTTGKSLSYYTRKILTDEGICFTYNLLHFNDLYTDEVVPPKIDDFELGVKRSTWDREAGYLKDISVENEYPTRSIGAGVKQGLGFYIVSPISQDACDMQKGFKVLIHSPDNSPMARDKSFVVDENTRVNIAIKPYAMITSEELRDYSVDVRKCLFKNERKLKYFKVYTAVNCEIECFTEFIREECGCVKFSMPRFNSTKVCMTSEEIKCYSEKEDDYFYSSDEDSPAAKCNCLPPCFSIEYSNEISQSPIIDDTEDEFLTYFQIFFKETSFVTSKRHELYGNEEFIANCGGLLGLFMGFSALSFVEVFYFSTIRSISNLFERRRRR